MVIGIFDKIKKGFIKAGDALKRGVETVMDFAAPIVDTVAPIAADFARTAGYGGLGTSIDAGAGLFRQAHNLVGGGRRRAPALLSRRIDDEF
jgi:hypothetical protein